MSQEFNQEQFQIDYNCYGQLARQLRAEAFGNIFSPSLLVRYLKNWFGQADASAPGISGPETGRVRCAA